MTREQLDAIRARFDSGLSLEYDETEALLAEVKRLTAERDAAFQRGVAAMREAAVAVASKRADLPKHSDLDSAWCRSAECILDELRHLPVPADKS